MRASGGRPRAFYRAAGLRVRRSRRAARGAVARRPLGTPARDPLLHGARRSSPSGCACATAATTSGLEAAALAPAILLLRSPGAAMLVCVAADAIAKQLTKNRRWTLSSAFDLAQLSLAYAAAALFADALHAVGGGPVALAALAVAVLLVFFLVNTALVFAYLDLSGLVPRKRLPEIALFQFVALALLAPIVVLEVLVYPAYGAAGTLLAFFPVVLASVVMRNLSSMERRVEEVSRQNRELDVMRDISITFGVSARVDRYERVFAAVARLLPVEAMAVIEWTGDTDDDLVVHLSEGAEATRGEVLAWARRNRLDERRVDRAAGLCEIATGDARDVRLAAGTPYQVRVALSTFEMHSGLLVLESTSPALHASDSLASLRTIADHIALVLQDRSIRAQMQELSERNRERAETLDQILEISNDLKRNRTLDDLFQSIASAVARGLGFQQVVLSLYDREQNVFTPRAHFGMDERWEALRAESVPAEEITKHWNDRNRVSKSYHVRERASREGALGVAASRPGARRRRGGLESERAALDPALLGGPPSRLPPRRRAAQRPLPVPRDDPVARDLREPGRGGHRERALLQRGARAVDPRLPDGRLQPPPLPGRPAAGARTCRASRAAPDGPDARHRRLQVDQRPLRPPGRRRDPAGHRRRDPERGPRRHGPARPLRRRRVRARAARDARRPTPSSWPSACGDAWTNGSSACRIRTRSSGRRSRSAWRPIPTTPPKRRTSSTRPTPRSTAPSTAARTRSSRPPSRDRGSCLFCRTERRLRLLRVCASSERTGVRLARVRARPDA